VKIKFKKLDLKATLPQRQTEGSAGYDLATIESGIVAPNQSITLKTGLAIQIPEGYAGFILSRSGHGFKHGLRLCNSVGCTDSDYIGEVKIKIHNDSQIAYEIKEGERIAQLVVVPYLSFDCEWVKELDKTERGENGFGSTN